MVEYCCFIWTQELILKPLGFSQNLGSDEDWVVCQLLIEHVNSKRVRSKRINLEGNTHAQEINVSQYPV
jgi:hypothetical protein